MKKRTPRRTMPLWYWPLYGDAIAAWTKSEARASLKRVLGLRRLPVGASLYCVGEIARPRPSLWEWAGQTVRAWTRSQACRLLRRMVGLDGGRRLVEIPPNGLTTIPAGWTLQQLRRTA